MPVWHAQRLALAIEGSRDGIWEWDLVTGMAYFSPRCQELFGRPSDGVDIRPKEEWAQWQHYHPDDAIRRDLAIRDHLEGRTPHYEGEWRVRHPDGSLHWLNCRGACTRDGAGRPLRFAGVTSDIDARKRAEEALKRSEERYAIAMQAGGSGYWDWIIATDDYYWSPRLLEMHGLPPDLSFTNRLDLLGRIPFHPEDWSKWVLATAEFFAGAGTQFEMSMRTVRDGEIRWFHMVGLLARDASGAPLRWSGSTTDITRRKRAEAALRESEERFALVVGGTNQGIFDWNLEIDRIYLSARAQEMCGITPGEAWRSRDAWLKLMVHSPPGDRDRSRQALRRHLKGEDPQYLVEFQVFDRGGASRWVRQRGVGLRDPAGRVYRLAGSLEDITEHKNAEVEIKRSKDELRARQEMLDLAQQAARAVAFDWRVDGGETSNYWPPELEAMYGLVPGAYDGSFKAWKSLIQRDDWRAVDDALLLAVKTGNVAAEFRVVHANGAVHWLQAKGRMLVDKAGAPVRMIGFMFDVTDRHAAEDELHRLERQLRQAQRLEAMGTLAGGIAHDFNNILAAILGYGEMALRNAPAGSRLRRDLESITVAGERGRALVDRILAFSRSGEAERVSVHVEKVVHESLDLLGASLPSGVVVKAELAAGRAAMRGDPTQIHQVITNLAMNGVQAMPGGGVLSVGLTTRALDAQLLATTGSAKPGRYIVLTVADAGCGITAPILDRIFDPFFTTKEAGVGTGLGLSLVHGIVTEVGGVIDVATRPGEGSAFTVYLPHCGEVDDMPEDEVPEIRRGSGERVLIVDDEEALVELASGMLASIGYAPTSVTSSVAALEAFRADPGRFDVVVTDERMPGMPGSVLIREIRRIRRAVPVVLVSGYLGGTVAERAYNAGADEVLQKPLSARALADCLARVLQAR